MNIDNMNSDMGLLLIIRDYFSSHYGMRRYIYENEDIMKKAGYVFELAAMAGPLEQLGTLEDHNRQDGSDYRKLFESMAQEIGVTYRDLHLALRRLLYRDARYHNKILQLRPDDFFAFIRNNRDLLVRDVRAAIDAYNKANGSEDGEDGVECMNQKKVLFVDCCLRGSDSRTARLAARFLEKIGDRYCITRVALDEEDLNPFTGSQSMKRDALTAAGDYEDPLFDYAKQFAEADKIIVAAPLWDGTFPARLRSYLERICVCGITFCYTDKGEKGLGRADKMLYISTVGGPNPKQNLGILYLQRICEMTGIPSFDSIIADCLDFEGADVNAILDSKKEEIEAKAINF